MWSIIFLLSNSCLSTQKLDVAVLLAMIFCFMSHLGTLSRNRSIHFFLLYSHSPKPFWPIRRQDTKIGGYHLLFPLTFVQEQGKDWTASLVENVTTSEFSPHLKLFLIICMDRSIDTLLFSPAVCPCCTEAHRNTNTLYLLLELTVAYHTHFTLRLGNK